ncbi:MAG: hypothetical protein ACYC7J_00770 [Syntrophales bacterium]
MSNKDATTDLARKSSIGHWGRVAAMFLSCGFIYPHAMTEYDDAAKPDIGNAVTVKNE